MQARPVGDDIQKVLGNALRDLPEAVQKFARREVQIVALGERCLGLCFSRVPRKRYLIVVDARQAPAMLKRILRHEVAHAILMDAGDSMDHIGRPREEAEEQVATLLRRWGV